MAEHLASIFGTEKDRVNCPFYFKIGACRHGDRCSRLHNRPSISPTILFSNMYLRPDLVTPGVGPQGQTAALDPRKVQQHFEDFYEDIFRELSKYGEIESLNICDNLADHMVGNVYVLFREAEQAAAALQAMTGRFYAGRPIIVDFSPVTDFREATCRQYEENSCNRNGYCNFMHLKKISKELRRELFGYSHKRERSRSRSPNPPPYNRGGGPDRSFRSRGDFPSQGGGGGGGRGRGRRFEDRRFEFDRFQHQNHRGYERSPPPNNYRRGYSRSRSPAGRRSPVRENSAERRAKIEQWNREREQRQDPPNGNTSPDY